jgi:flagellar biosynthesis GTPase FlhF
MGNDENKPWGSFTHFPPPTRSFAHPTVVLSLCVFRRLCTWSVAAAKSANEIHPTIFSTAILRSVNLFLFDRNIFIMANNNNEEEANAIVVGGLQQRQRQLASFVRDPPPIEHGMITEETLLRIEQSRRAQANEAAYEAKEAANKAAYEAKEAANKAAYEAKEASNRAADQAREASIRQEEASIRQQEQIERMAFNMTQLYLADQAAERMELKDLLVKMSATIHERVLPDLKEIIDTMKKDPRPASGGHDSPTAGHDIVARP